MSEAIVFQYLKAMTDYNASDLYLTIGRAPLLRTDNDIISLNDQTLAEEDIHDVLNAILTPRQKREFQTKMELNTALDMAEYGRFRVNVMRQRQVPALVIRRIISMIPSFTELKLPPVLEELALEKRGLVLVSGMTGSGKTTTLASMINYRNMSENGHIITIEDPIEYYHEHKRCVVTQREVGVDTESFSTALKNALRQRPDVILVGEIRDKDVMEQALTISETGHLCLATLHTNNAYQAIERVVNFFPEEHSNQVRMNLSLNLKAVISQRLLPCVHGGLIPAIEVMLNQGLIRECILKGPISRIKEVMEQNTTLGMCSFDQSLLKLYQDGMITEETTITNSDKPSEMKVKIQKLKLSGKGKAGASEQPPKNKEVTKATLEKLDTSRISLSE